MVRMCCLWGLTLILLIPGGLRGEVCKWVDDAGTVHYEAECPENMVGENFELEAQDGSPMGSEARSPGQLADRDRWARNQPVSALRSLPPAQSRYLVSSDWRVRVGRGGSLGGHHTRSRLPIKGIWTRMGRNKWQRSDRSL